MPYNKIIFSFITLFFGECNIHETLCFLQDKNNQSVRFISNETVKRTKQTVNRL